MGRTLPSSRALLGAVLAATLCLTTGCQSGSSSDAPVTNDSGDDDGGDNGTESQLVHFVTCAAELDTVAHLPAIDTEQNVVDESTSPDDVQTEHAMLAATYRGQAQALASSLGRSEADLAALYKQAARMITHQRKTRPGREFAIWVTDEADDCPPL